MKTTTIFYCVILFLIITSSAWAGADITGFDGYKWGTKQSVIQKATGEQPHEVLNGKFSTIYHYKA